MLLQQILAYAIHVKKIKKLYRINTFNISAATQIDIFQLPNRSYSVSDIEDYSEYIIREHETVSGNPPIRTYVNKIENRIPFKIKTRNYLEALTTESVKLLGSTKNKIKVNKSQ